MGFLPENNWRTLAGRSVLVTGASGFIGSRLVKGLVEMGCEVSALLRPSADTWRIRDVLDQVEVVPGDLSDLDSKTLARSLSNVDIIYHMAAAGVNPSKGDSVSMLQANVPGTLRLLQLARELEVDRFVFCGSCSEYESGENLTEDFHSTLTSEYAVSKSAAWMLCQVFSHRYDLPVVGLRPFMVYGPFEAAYRLIPHTIANCLRGADIRLTAGEQTRDFVFIDDVAEAFYSAAAVPKVVGGTFNVCTGIATSIREIVSATVDITATASNPLFGAMPYRDTETWTMSGSPKKAAECLGWTAGTSVNEGLTKTVQWFREQSHLYTEYNH